MRLPLPFFIDPTENNCANSNANDIVVQTGCCGDANANALSAATNVNNVNQGGFC